MDDKSNKDLLLQRHEMVHKVTYLPHKILQYYNVDGLSQMILHELSHKDAFNLKRATYLVDNPDFDHLIGVAGFCSDECHFHQQDLWKKPDSFVDDMKDATFHNDVRKFLKNSLRRKDINLSDSDDVRGLGRFLGMESPHCFSWSMKHGNHGILLFDKDAEKIDDWEKSLLANTTALLSLCSII